MQRLAVSVKEAAELAGVSEPTIYEWIARGLPHLRTKGGGKIVVRIADLDAWMEAEAHANVRAL